MNWKQTYTGVAWNLSAPRAEDVRAEDIAHALANQCRFTGHCYPFYSVAEHSVRVMWRVRELHPEAKTLHLAALLHDAHEAYLGDMSTPLKREMASRRCSVYDDMAKEHDDAIASWAGVPVVMLKVPAIKHADRELLATEKRDLMCEEPRPWVELPQALIGTINPWPASAAEDTFMNELNELGLR